MTRRRDQCQHTSEVQGSRSSLRCFRVIHCTGANAENRVFRWFRRAPSAAFRSTVCAWMVAALLMGAFTSAFADDCRRVPYILVLFDASGYMKEKDRYQFLLQQMNYFKEAMPLTADGLFNVGLRHYGLKVGLGCNNTESILAMQPWDPERFINSFPKSVSYGVSSLSAGLRAAEQEIAQVEGKSIIILIGGGLESCKVDPIKVADRIAFNDPELEIHTFQIGDAQEGRFNLKGIAQKCRGTYTQVEEINSSAGWHAWMKRHLVMPCGPPAPAAGAPSAMRIAPVTFDYNSFTVRSKDPAADGENRASLEAVARFLQGKPTRRVVLHAFTDGKGKHEYNLQLSRRRAEAVGDQLTRSLGVNPSQISIVTHGASGEAPRGQESRAARRVEFELFE